MDGIGNTLENVGLAQEIKNGLAKSLMKPLPGTAEDVAAVEAELSAKSLDELKGLRLGNKIIQVMSETNPAAVASAEAFKASAGFKTLCKYTAANKVLAKEKPTAKLFEEMRPLGKGAFGAVFLTFSKFTGHGLAVKKMVKAIAKQNKMIKDVLIEREVLSKMRSPFCVNLHYSYQNDVEIALVLTLMPGGDLSFMLHERYNGAGGKKGTFEPLPTGGVQFYGASMAMGLQAIHDAGYVYRDLKPQNVLLDSEGKVRISDMGLTANITGGTIKQCSGTRGYWSPETIQKQPYQCEPDWWSLGVTMFVLHSDKMPFHGKDDESKDAMTLAGEIDFKHDEPDDLQAVIKAFCTIDMKQRLGCNGGLEEVKKHPYFNGFDWAALEAGTLPAPVLPNVNDINAPDKSEIAKFVKPKDVEWTDADQKDFADWDYFDSELWLEAEAMTRIQKYKELSGGGGGAGGCCTIA